jgi:hypothetical protein
MFRLGVGRVRARFKAPRSDYWGSATIDLELRTTGAIPTDLQTPQDLSKVQPFMSA